MSIWNWPSTTPTAVTSPGNGSGRSRGGDFLTSPEVSPLFGETLAELVIRESSRAGLSRPTVVDAGAGSGSLLGPLLSTLGERADPWAVEVSPPARRRLVELVGEGRVVESLDGLPERIEGFIFANELLDNLPMALARRRAGGWRELRVGHRGDKLGWVESPARPEVEDWLERFAGPTPRGRDGGVPAGGRAVGNRGPGPPRHGSPGGIGLRRHGPRPGRPPPGRDPPHLSGPSPGPPPPWPNRAGPTSPPT